MRELVLSITQEAVGKLKQMREAEGRFLEADLLKNCEAMAEELAFVREQGEGVMLEYAKRLRKRVDSLLAGSQIEAR